MKMLLRIIEHRRNLSDHALLMLLKALSYAAKDNREISTLIVEYPSALQELFDYLQYPQMDVKVQVSSLLATLRKQMASKSAKKLTPLLKRKSQLMKSQQFLQAFQWILIQFVNMPDLKGTHGQELQVLAKDQDSEADQVQSNDPSLNQFIQVCDTIQDILKVNRKANLQNICIQVDMPEKFWSCLGTYKSIVHKTKILQVMNAIAFNNKLMAKAIINTDGLQMSMIGQLVAAIEQKEAQIEEPKPSVSTEKVNVKKVQFIDAIADDQ